MEFPQAIHILPQMFCKFYVDLIFLAFAAEQQFELQGLDKAPPVNCWDLRVHRDFL
jgi:hypothetical protein